MKTSELVGAQLNWAVALAEGWKPEKVRDAKGEYWWLFKHPRGMNPKHYHPSTHWALGGAIIERECMQLWKGGEWCASLDQSFNPPEFSTGTTPLIAAMRCYVANKLGDEVELPEGL